MFKLNRQLIRWFRDELANPGSGNACNADIIILELENIETTIIEMN